MSKNKNLKKKIIYRSSHRGTKEMDFLLGKFVKENIDSFTTSELNYLKDLIELDDEILQKWYFNNINKKLIPNNKVTNMLKKYKF